MLIWSGTLSSSKGVWGRLVNCVFSPRAPWEFDFFVQSRFKHIPVKPWMLYALIPCSQTTYEPVVTGCYLNSGLKLDPLSLHSSTELRIFKKSAAHALPCGFFPFPCSVHIHECVCTGIYECEDVPFLPLKMTHKTSVLATYPVKAAWGMPFQHSRTSG